VYLSLVPADFFLRSKACSVAPARRTARFLLGMPVCSSSNSRSDGSGGAAGEPLFSALVFFSPPREGFFSAQASPFPSVDDAFGSF